MIVTFLICTSYTQIKKNSTMADAKQGKTPSEDFYNGSSQSRVVLAKPRLGGFGSSNFGSSSSKSTNLLGSVLRPSQLKPGINPFLKVTEQANESEAQKEKNDSSSEERFTESKDAEVPKFVPLGINNVPPRTTNPVPAPPQPTTSTSSEGFVFGQNLSERVVIQENANNGEALTVDHSSSNGTSELLFTSAAASVKESNQETSSGSASDGLAAAAAEYERSHARPLPPTSNCTLTGEEDETNVLQISCRLFAWETGSWRERGRGVLRLNDACGGGSRLVARVSGSLRVVLNTKLWPDMVVQQAGSKSLRITAADAQQQIKLYLIMGAPGDIIQLNRALTARVATSKRTSNNTCTQNVTSQKAAERLEADADDSEFLNKPDDDIPEDDIDDEAVVNDDNQNEPENNERLEPARKFEEYESHVDGMTEDRELNTLKRKEPAEDEKSSKRQCPEIIIE